MKKSSSDLSSSVWLSGSDALWHSSAASPSGRISHTRRLSITSDSGDTGIGTSCSDSLEDHPTSSSSLTFKSAYPLGSLSAAHGMPSTPRSSLSRTREDRLDSSRWNSNYFLSGGSRHYGLSTDSSLDMKDTRPMKKWSSLSKLSVPDGLTADSRAEKTGSRHSLEHVGRESAISQYSCRHRTTCLHHSMEQLKLDDKDSDKRQYMGIDCKYKYDACNSKTLSTSAVSSRRHTLDMTYSALPESKPSTLSEPYGQKNSHYVYQGGVPIQPSVRTQMWLTDQLHANFQDRRLTDETCVTSSWQPLEHLRQETAQPQVGSCSSRTECATTPLSQDVSKWESLMKIKEGLLRQKEIVIDRQKQQICHLQQALRANDLQANQAVMGHAVNGEDFAMHHLKQNGKSEQHIQERTKPHFKDQEDIERKLACAETEIVQLHEVLNQSTSKTSEEIKKLEEKIKTRDKYINSLRKKCQKENELNREKQRRIETLEKYLADLPSLDDVQKQSQRLQVVEEENKQLKEAMQNLEKLLNESRTQCQEKEAQTECQKQREKDLVMTVQSLQQKVQKCLEDGVRLPILDNAQIQSENDRLREQNERANKVIDNQQSQIENMTAEIQALREKLYQERLAAQELKEKLEENTHCTQQLEELSFEREKLKEDNEHMRGQIEKMQISRQPLSDKLPVAEQLFKEMSHCMFDLKALCSILNQRVHGKEPNLSLLLGIGSLNSSFEENEACHSTESLTKKLSEAHQLRKDIDDLRTMLSDCYAQDMGDNCITQ
ncbi:centrosomal protein of 85 kDa-like isoform X3 [Xenopus tropicalis]|uniref:Centrosomal protein 85kDa-like n=1 Tax=Xenopus tropicalis TaxID=8364 RepID=A0A803J5Y5_XENTR|nr:centrosomal protein of 85 kDa-like isoform X3 [Xenopus tropicalis]